VKGLGLAAGGSSDREGLRDLAGMVLKEVVLNHTGGVV
jgi:hypothetical protein